jgi:hypothetical protein
MEKTACQAYLMNNQEIKETLSSLGYILLDRGPYWQTNAIYRNGDNKTALQIYKDSGVWKDHVQQTPFMPLDKLIKITLGTTDQDLVNSYIKKKDPFSFESRVNVEPKIKMEKIYEEKYLNKLLPHYKFYNDRGISDAILSKFKGGMATEGKMNGRFIFPIFNLNKKIHGFSGRDLFESKNRPKWKHIGQKSKWIFPNHLFSLESFSKNIILVESIGDVLKLFQSGYTNVLCTFGLDFSPSLISHMIGLNPNKIIISLNDDSSSSSNAGRRASCKNFIKILSFFDHEKICIHPPTKNDFGDMNLEEIKKWETDMESIDKEKHDQKIINYSRELHKEGYIPKSMGKNLKNLIKIYE